MSPIRIVKPRLAWVEEPRAPEIKALNLVLLPQHSAFRAGPENAPSAEAWRYGMAIEGAAQAPTRDGRIFGRPILQVESIMDRGVGETALVVNKPTEIMAVSTQPTVLERIKLNPLPWIRENKLKIGLGAYFATSLSAWAAFISFYPLLALKVIAGSFAVLVGACFILLSGPGILRDLMALPNRLLRTLLRGAYALSPGREPLRLPPGTQIGGGPFRGVRVSGKIFQIRNLSDKVIRPIRDFSRYPDYSPRKNEIVSLGNELRELPLTHQEFRRGIEALNQVLLHPPVIRYSSPNWKFYRDQLSLTALEALVSALSHRQGLAQRRDIQLLNLAEVSLKKLTSPEMLEQIFGKPPRFDLSAALKIQKPLDLFSELLGEGHPAILQSRDKIRQFAQKWKFEGQVL